MTAEAATWPAYAKVEADGYTLTQDTDVRRTPFDDGLVRQEKRFTGAMTVRGLSALLADDATRGRFQGWARRYAHTWFAWTDPDDGVTRRVRVRGGAGAIRYTARVTGGNRRWVLACELEGLMHDTIETGG